MQQICQDSKSKEDVLRNKILYRLWWGKSEKQAGGY
jgi:hypothetical protein